MFEDQFWSAVDWVAFDTETSGKYPFESEICEIAAVRWSKGQVIDRFQTLLRVSKPMSDEVIAIHHITNEMLKGAPDIKQKLPEFFQFAKDACLIAHHAPFDMGFMAIDLEKQGLPFPKSPVFCSSLLSRNILTEPENHRLQTLVKYFGLPQREAHRALADAEACLDVSIRCFERLGNPKLSDLQSRQGRLLKWESFSVQILKSDSRYRALVEALENKLDVQIEYQGGSQPGRPRTIKPVGIVRSPGQDFIVAESGDQSPPKRFYLNKIKVSRF